MPNKPKSRNGSSTSSKESSMLSTNQKIGIAALVLIGIAVGATLGVFAFLGSQRQPEEGVFTIKATNGNTNQAILSTYIDVILYGFNDTNRDIPSNWETILDSSGLNGVTQALLDANPYQNYWVAVNATEPASVYASEAEVEQYDHVYQTRFKRIYPNLDNNITMYEGFNTMGGEILNASSGVSLMTTGADGMNITAAGGNQTFVFTPNQTQQTAGWERDYDPINNNYNNWMVELVFNTTITAEIYQIAGWTETLSGTDTLIYEFPKMDDNDVIIASGTFANSSVAREIDTMLIYDPLGTLMFNSSA